MIKLLLCVGLGFVGHQTSPIFDVLEKRLNGNGMAWPRIGRYAIGGIMIRLAARVMLRGVKRPDVDIVDGAIASGMIGVGAGVAAGYVLDMILADVGGVKK